MTDLNRRSSRASMRSKPLGQLLVENGDATSEQVSQALKAQDKEGGLIGGILLRMGACSPDAIGHALFKQVQVTDVQCEEMNGSDAAVKLVSKDLCAREKLCPFEVLGKIGRGGNAEVFKVRHRPSGKLAALKVISRFLKLDPEIILRFQQEFEAIRPLRHPNIVRAVGWGEHELAA